MDAFVVYHSETGNTLKVALAVASGLKQAGFGVKSLPVEEADPSEAKQFDLIVLGTPVHAFTASKKIKEFAGKLPACVGANAAVFCTCGLHRGFALRSLEGRLRKKGYVIAGSFSCPGRDSFGPLKLSGGARKTRPNEGDLARAHEFARKLRLR